MNVNILYYSFFGIAGGQEVDHTFAKFMFENFVLRCLWPIEDSTPYHCLNNTKFSKNV